MTIDYQTLHKNAFVADLHCDTWHPMSRGYQLAERHDEYHIDIPRLIEGGVNLQIFATFVNPYFRDSSAVAFVERAIARQTEQFAASPDKITIVQSMADIDQAAAENKIAALLAIEGGEALANDPANLERYHKLGVRIFTLVHDRSLDWCISHADSSPSFAGLTELGRNIISEMNRLGIVPDVSHSSDGTAEAVLAASAGPVIASHSNVRARCNHTRNLPDHLMKGIADSGGVIGVTFVNQFLSDAYREIEVSFFRQNPELAKELSRLFVSELRQDQLDVEWQKHLDDLAPLSEQLQGVQPKLQDVVDHIDYMVNLVGADHVALGSDYDGITSAPTNLENCSRLPNITCELIGRGYSEGDVKKILGENVRCLLRSVMA